MTTTTRSAPFSSVYQQSEGYQRERQCIGQQGSVRLCEHVQITWASIKAHIDDWRRQQQQRAGGGEVGGRDWQACLSSFSIECHEAIHDLRCTASENPTWPRACLHSDGCQQKYVVLNLEWTPHSRIDTLSLTADGRIPAPELRALFQRLRHLGSADTLYTPTRPGDLPEIAYFSPSPLTECFIYYQTGGINSTPLPLTAPLVTATLITTATTQPSFRPLPSHLWSRWWFDCCKNKRETHGQGGNGQNLDIGPHYKRGGRSTDITGQCLVVSYQQDISWVCETMAITDPAVKIEPTDHWIHAMDPHIYPYPQ